MGVTALENGPREQELVEQRARLAAEWLLSHPLGEACAGKAGCHVAVASHSHFLHGMTSALAVDDVGGARAAAALVALASGQQVETINKTHGWRGRSQMVRSYARLVQLQAMTQEPVLRDTPASALLATYENFFK